MLNLEELKILAKHIDCDIRAMLVALGENKNNKIYSQIVRADLERRYSIRAKLYSMIEQYSMDGGQLNGTVAEMADNNKQSSRQGHDA